MLAFRLGTVCCRGTFVSNGWIFRLPTTWFERFNLRSRGWPVVFRICRWRIDGDVTDASTGQGCVGHERTIATDSTVQSLDMKEEGE